MRYILLFIVLASFYIPSVASNQSVLNSTHPTCTKAWVGAAIAAGASLLGGLMANNSQRKGTKEQLRAQELENQRNREYNLMLAQQQNAWNVEQWERENEYNDPAAQMKRFKNAGLNPDLMAGSGAQNLSAPSPTMTAGAPSTPQDMSALGRRPSFGEAVQMALRDSMIGAQIDNIKANTRKTNAEAGLSETEAKYLDAEKELGQKINQRVFEKLEHEIDEAFNNAVASGYRVEELNYAAMSRRLEFLYKEREMEAIISKLENEAKISQADAKLAIESYTYRFLGIKSEAELAKFNAALPEQLEKRFGEDAAFAALILQGVNFILQNSGNITKFTKSNSKK